MKPTRLRIFCALIAMVLAILGLRNAAAWDRSWLEVNASSSAEAKVALEHGKTGLNVNLAMEME